MSSIRDQALATIFQNHHSTVLNSVSEIEEAITSAFQELSQPNEILMDMETSIAMMSELVTPEQIAQLRAEVAAGVVSGPVALNLREELLATYPSIYVDLLRRYDLVGSILIGLYEMRRNVELLSAQYDAIPNVEMVRRFIAFFLGHERCHNHQSAELVLSNVFTGNNHDEYIGHPSEVEADTEGYHFMMNIAI